MRKIIYWSVIGLIATSSFSAEGAGDTVTQTPAEAQVSSLAGRSLTGMDDPLVPELVAPEQQEEGLIIPPPPPLPGALSATPPPPPLPGRVRAPVASSAGSRIMPKVRRANPVLDEILRTTSTLKQTPEAAPAPVVSSVTPLKFTQRSNRRTKMDLQQLVKTVPPRQISVTPSNDLGAEKQLNDLMRQKLSSEWSKDMSEANRKVVREKVQGMPDEELIGWWYGLKDDGSREFARSTLLTLRQRDMLDKVELIRRMSGEQLIGWWGSLRDDEHRDFAWNTLLTVRQRAVLGKLDKMAHR